MNLDGEKLNEYILNLPKEEKIKILQSDEIRNKYLEPYNHYPFVWLVQSLGDDLLFFIDNSYLSRIISDEKSVDKMNAIMTCGSKYTGLILSNDNSVEFILKHSYLHTFIKVLDSNFGNCIINYAIKTDNSKIINLVGNLNCEEQNKVFTNENISKLLEFKNNDYNYLFNLDSNIILKLIKYKPFLDTLMNANINTFNKIVNNGFVFPDYLINNSLLINKYVNIFNPNLYRNAINILIKNNYSLASNIENARKKYVKKEITSIKDGYLIRMDNYFINNDDFLINEVPFNILNNLRKLNNSAKLKDKLAALTQVIQFELLVDTYFKDIPYNFLSNMIMMLNYIKQINENIISEDNLKLYMKIYHFNSLSIKERIEFINSFNDDIDYAKMFYEDYRKCRDHSYKLMNDKVIKLNKDSKLYNKKLSKDKGVDIYELNGDDFFAYAHVTHASRYEKNNVYWKDDASTISISLIGTENINTFGDHQIKFEFYNLKPQNIMHIYHSDSYTAKMHGTKKINEIYTPNNLLKNTKKYNEILYSEKNFNIKPDFIISYDVITQVELIIAKQLNIPILVINTDKYKKTDLLEDANKDKYINPLFDKDPIIEGRFK